MIIVKWNVKLEKCIKELVTFRWRTKSYSSLEGTFSTSYQTSQKTGKQLDESQEECSRTKAAIKRVQ